ncbi:putative dehydrogenase [Lewinella aquimaris]|uniref:Putative dehydrogenase n=1 Tax=Neolewinella aquimaris TaxID=1835722 RepID=A0A840EE44_9BACT|nr:Gfo/Idh/MocA family oxidoreductase [Neolewinella aquimaris]MBB4080228.1 putative dehydrogenase [Neolewinella aquimaris]
MSTNNKVGIIGCGHISDTHIKSWQKAKHSTPYAVFDISREAAEAKAAKYGIPEVYTDIEEIITACDVLDVCTPPQTHFDIVMKIIASGKHLIVEKPLVTDIDQWEKIKAALKDSPSKISVLHNLKYSLAIQQAKAVVDSGRIGKLLRINRYFLTHPNSDRMLVGNSHWSHKLPGGRWYETMPHELYITHFFAGWSELTNVVVHHGETALPGAPAEEVLFTLQNEGVLSTYHYSSNCEMNKRYIEIIGSKGMITIDVLGDMLFVDDSIDSKRRRAVGIIWMDSLKRVFAGVKDRVHYFRNKSRGVSPHTRIILQFDEYLQGLAPSPTPLEEIDFVVTFSERVGKAIDKKLLSTVEK